MTCYNFVSLSLSLSLLFFFCFFFWVLYMIKRVKEKEAHRGLKTKQTTLQLRSSLMYTLKAWLGAMLGRHRGLIVNCSELFLKGKYHTLTEALPEELFSLGIEGIGGSESEV